MSDPKQDRLEALKIVMRVRLRTLHVLGGIEPAGAFLVPRRGTGARVERGASQVVRAAGIARLPGR